MKVRVGKDSFEVPTDFTFREARLIRQHTGLTVAEIVGTAVERGDSDVAVAFALVALSRAGASAERLAGLSDLEIGEVEMVLDDEDAEGNAAAADEAANPPASN